ncbi:prepilin-type N-terminal cleavage/methylation domain-containing protein [Candidatus Curtissbacteria bacterium]|nr:prepilin-type N-terminal cleavage/methylation domain-containing protein [Candidatus Curtissbacteria bacterium]
MPKVVHSLRFYVHSANNSVNRQPKTVNGKSKGFTLIELLIVITIIGILVATGVYSWQAAQVKARDDRRKTDLKAIQQALESYYQVNGYYPGWGAPGGGWTCEISSATYPQFQNALQPTYISKLPRDPTATSASGDYYYAQGSPPQTYSLYSVLENTKDPDYPVTSLSSACTAGTTVYHYKVTNP